MSLADLLRQLPPDVVDHNILCFLDRPSRCNLKLASREVAGLVRARRGSVTLDMMTGRGSKAEEPDGQQLRDQIWILREYRCAIEIDMYVDSGDGVTATLVSPSPCACGVAAI